jgi:hypothetical protein
MEVLKCNKGPVECSIWDDDGSGELLLELQVSNELRLKGDVKPELIDELKSYLTIRNPEWDNMEKLGRYNGHLDEHLEFLERRNGYWVMPQGFFDPLLMLLMKHGCAVDVEFPLRTAISPYKPYEFQGELRPDQKLAAENALFRPYGVLWWNGAATPNSWPWEASTTACT